MTKPQSIPDIDNHHFISSARRRRISTLRSHHSSPLSSSKHSTGKSPLKIASHSPLHRVPPPISPRKNKCFKTQSRRRGIIGRLLILMTVVLLPVISLWNQRAARINLEELLGDEYVLRSKFFHVRERKQSSPRKRIVFHTVTTWDRPETHSKWFEFDQSLLVNPGQESPSQPDYPYGLEDGRYEPMQPWQKKYYPTCNHIHELDMKQDGRSATFVSEDRGHGRKVLTKKYLSSSNLSEIVDDNIDETAVYNEDDMLILGRGWFRHTWKTISGSSSETAVLKTLRFERDFMAEYYELHRRDAIAMERLTKSPYIINVYGACGPSAINEFADFIKGFHNFRDFAKQLRGRDNKTVLKLKLQIAAMIALGVQHIHEIDGVNNATMVHYDINPMNVAITFGGIPKLNDFNVAEFLQWDTQKGERRPFVGRFKEPWWRSPEEMHENPLLDEKVDVYSLGNVLYYLLTGHSPRGQTTKERIDEQRDFVRRGVLPRAPWKYVSSKDPATLAMVRAIAHCYEPDPKKRSSARDIATGLLDALDELVE